MCLTGTGLGVRSNLIGTRDVADNTVCDIDPGSRGTYRDNKGEREWTLKD